LKFGCFVITWSSDGQLSQGKEVYAQRYSSSAVKVGSEFLVNSVVTANSQQFPCIASLPNGSFIIAWQYK